MPFQDSSKKNPWRHVPSRTLIIVLFSRSLFSHGLLAVHDDQPLGVGVHALSGHVVGEAADKVPIHP